MADKGLFEEELPKQKRPKRNMDGAVGDQSNAHATLRVDMGDAASLAKLLKKVAVHPLDNTRVSFNGGTPIKATDLVYDLRTQEGAQKFFDNRELLQTLNHPVFIVCDKPVRVKDVSSQPKIKFKQEIVKDGEAYTAIHPQLEKYHMPSTRQGGGPNSWGDQVFVVDEINFSLMEKEDPETPDHFQVSFEIGSPDVGLALQSFLHRKMEVAAVEPEFQNYLALGDNNHKNEPK